MMRIVFIGSSAYGLPALQMLCGEELKPLLVVSQPDKPSGRKLNLQPTPISQYAIANQLPLLCPENINSPQSIQRIAMESPDLLITASYGGYIGKQLRHLCPLGAINLHPSLLPKYRGASPIQSAILNGELLTGTSIYRLVAAMDAGPVIMQQSLEILPGENYSELHERLANQAAQMLNDLLHPYRNLAQSSHTRFQERAQEQQTATWCPKIDPSLCMISWHNSAITIINKIRAFSLNPGAWVYFRGAKLKILEAQLSEAADPAKPGCIANIIKNTGFTVNCLDRQILVTKVQAANKNIMYATAFANGARISSGEKLWM